MKGRRNEEDERDVAQVVREKGPRKQAHKDHGHNVNAFVNLLYEVEK